MPNATRTPTTATTAATTAEAIAALTSDAAARAIHLDFEGFTNAAPALLGVLVDDAFETLVLDPVLRPAAEARGLRSCDGEAVLRGIVERARLENRLICSFGNRECEAALADFGVDLRDRFVNVHRVARAWWRRNRTECPKRRGGKKDTSRWRPRRPQRGSATSRVGK